MAAAGIIAQEVASDVRMTDTRADEADRSRPEQVTELLQPEPQLEAKKPEPEEKPWE